MSALSNLSRFLSPIPCRVRGPEHSCGAAIRGWMASLGACAAFLAVPALAAPNIVVILTDDQDTSTMVAMPKTLERLAAQGTSFSNYMISNPTCAPSRATLLTGQYAHNHGVLNNDPPYGGYGKLDASNTVPVWLQAAGYHTSHLGKYVNGSAQGGVTAIPPGWNDFQGFSTKYYNYGINVNGSLVSHGSAPEDYQTDVLASRAVTALRARAAAGVPFFMTIAPFAPHDEGSSGAPVPPPRYAGLYANEPVPMPPSYNESDVSDKAKPIRDLPSLTATNDTAIAKRYRARLETIRAVDDLVESVVTTLETEGLASNTVIIYASDNGHFHGQHRIPDGKFRLYDEAVRVPLIIRGTGFTAGATSAIPVSNVDMATTIVRLAGATPRRTLDGQSIKQLLASPQTTSGRAILLENFNQATGLPTVAIRTDRYSYAVWPSNEVELFDLSIDPYQLESKHNESRYNNLKTALQTKLNTLKTCAGNSCLMRFP